MTHAYERLSFRALGFFLIHIQRCCFGVRAPDATMLACSFQEIQERLERRGQHTAFFAAEADAGKIADAFRDAIYAPDQEDKRFLGVSQPDFCDLFISNHLAWVPDGDEAFDNGSHILHFDAGDRVRLIGFKSMEDGYHHDPSTLVDLWLEADEFYGVLAEWHTAFEIEWMAAEKISEAEDGAEIK